MNLPGDFIWYELLTPDVDAALAFYGRVVGWKSGAAGPVPGYRNLVAPDAAVGGMLAMPSGSGFPGAVWVGYLNVEEVDAAVLAAQRRGAIPCMPPTDLPGVGRIAMLLDPQGAPFYVMRPAMEGVSRAFAPEVGHCQWNELVTTDPDAALAFYTQQFDWRKGDVMPMGPMGNYQFLLNHDVRFGAMLKRTREGARSVWRFYFGVDDIDRAARAVSESGGRLVSEPQPEPGGGFAVVAIDPQGAEFGIAGPRKG
jgi:predicted enzyme related to lactoylglutathione lyase